jgi:hypothetical protein
MAFIKKPLGQKGTQKKFSTYGKDIFPLSANVQSNRLNRWSCLPFCKKLRKEVRWSKPVRSAAVVVKFYVMLSPLGELNITLHLIWLLHSTSLKLSISRF